MYLVSTNASYLLYSCWIESGKEALAAFIVPIGITIVVRTNIIKLLTISLLLILMYIGNLYISADLLKSSMCE